MRLQKSVRRLRCISLQIPSHFLFGHKNIPPPKGDGIFLVEVTGLVKNAIAIVRLGAIASPTTSWSLRRSRLCSNVARSAPAVLSPPLLRRGKALLYPWFCPQNHAVTEPAAPLFQKSLQANLFGNILDSASVFFRGPLLSALARLCRDQES